MGKFNIALLDHGVLEGCVYSLVPQKTLQLFHGHSLVNRHGGERSAEFVGVYPRQFQGVPQFPKTGFHAVDFQTFIRSFERETGHDCRLPVLQN